MFLGANIDAIEVAGRFGIEKERAINYECDSVGTSLNYKVLSNAISAVRKSRSRGEAARMVEACCEEITQDYERRHR